MRFARFGFVALAITALMIPSLALAQTSRTTGALIGVITDSSGGVLPGVTVTITSPQLQGARSSVSDVTGEYSFPLLPPGTYKAQYELNGVKSVVRDNIVISLNQTTKINVPMQMAVSETLTVTASSVVVDPTQVAQQQNFKQDHLKYAVVGSANRSYQNVLSQAPGTGGANGPTGAGGGGNPQVLGANNAQNNFVLDGINTTDPVTHTFGNNLAFDAIQEISIQTLGKDAEYSSSGGTINVITKSGGNDLSGTADWRYNDVHFQSQGQETKPAGIPYYGGTPASTTLRFDKNLQPTKSSQPTLTVGGPVLRDRLWFFAALARPNTASTPPNINNFQPGTRTFKGWNNLGKLTFTPLANQTLTATFIDSYASIPHAENSSSYSPEAGSLQTQGSRTYGVIYDAILTSKWLLNAQFGHTPARLAVAPLGGLDAFGTQNLDNGVVTGNYLNAQGRTSTRDELLANTTYYLESFGTHAFKVGFNVNKTDFSSYNNSVGNPALIPGYDPSFCSSKYGIPDGSQCAGIIQISPLSNVQRIVLSVVNPISTVSSKQYAIFGQDEWNPVTRLTIRAGIRYEQVRWDAHSPNNPPNFKMIHPRLGVAYDVFNNSSSVAHGYAGKIMDDNQLTLPSFGVAQPSGVDYFTLNSKGKYVNTYQGVYITGNVYDPNLKPSYSNQFSLGFTQKVWRNTSIDVTGEYRKQHDLFEDYCGHVNAAGQEVDLPACILTNQPGFDFGVHNALKSDYRGITTKIESRPYDWLDVVASWTHGKSRGSTESTQNQNTSFDLYPVHFTNAYGYLSDDARNRVKLNGYLRLPLDFTVGLSQYWDDGLPWSVFQTASNTGVTGVALPYGTYFIEPRGSRRLPHFNQTDLQFQKDFHVGYGKVGVIASVFNVFNKETPVAINGNAGSRGAIDPSTGQLLINTDPNYNGTGKNYQQTGPNRLSATYGQYTSFQRPRRFEAGVRYEF